MLAVGPHGGMGGNAEDLVRQLEEMQKSGPRATSPASREGPRTTRRRARRCDASGGDEHVRVAREDGRAGHF